MRKDKTGVLVGILMLVIVVLIVVILYALVVKPAINGYIVEKQNDAYSRGIQDAVTIILNDIQQKGSTQIDLGNGQMLILRPSQQ